MQAIILIKGKVRIEKVFLLIYHRYRDSPLTGIASPGGVVVFACTPTLI